MTWATLLIVIPLGLFVLYMIAQIASYEAARRQIEQDLIDQWDKEHES